MDLSKAPVATVLGVSDLAKARSFYESKLALTPREVPGVTMYPCAEVYPESRTVGKGKG